MGGVVGCQLAIATVQDDMAEETGTPASVKFHYIKSSQFRVIHVDGAYGGITSRNYIAAALYNERNAIPQETELPVMMTEGGLATVVGSETIVKSKEGIVRELEAEILMDLPTAISFHDWLGKKIDELTKQGSGK